MNLLPMLVENDPLILRANQALLVQVIGTAASNAAYESLRVQSGVGGVQDAVRRPGRNRGA
jgi:hypothetical protein